MGNMQDKLWHFFENNGNPFFVGSIITKKAIYLNKNAREMFSVTTDDCDFDKIFGETKPSFKSMLKTLLERDKSTLVNDFTVNTSDNDKKLIDLHLGYFNSEETEFFLTIIPQPDTRMEMTKHIVSQSTRAEAIIEFDKELTLIHANEKFYQLFDAVKDTCIAIFHHKMGNAFSLEKKEKLQIEIHEALKNKERYYTEVEVLTVNGKKKWVELDFHKRFIDDSGEKLVCFANNIDEKKRRISKLNTLNQYMSVIQKSTTDILYRVDLETNTMYHYSDFGSIYDIENCIPNYVDVFMNSNIIHPDDKELYLKHLMDFEENGLESDTPIRFSLSGKEYQWYKITGKKIFDSNGNFKEIFGSLINVHSEHSMKEEFSDINQHFEALQLATGESFYIIDVVNKTLTQRGRVSDELNIHTVIENFPESVYPLFHPEDLETYKEYIEKTISGVSGTTQARLLTVKGNYEWYEIIGQIICDDDGNVSEVVGVMNNIHKEKTIEAKFTTLSQYFEAIHSLSGESLYTIDIKTKTLRSHRIGTEELGLNPIVENYPESIYNIIFPDDLENFKDFASKTLGGNNARVQIRQKTIDGTYKWYELISMIIKDSNGEPFEVLGKIKNIDEEHNLEENYSVLNQYLTAMQEISDDVLFRIDVKTMMFQSLVDEKESGFLGQNMPKHIDVLTKHNIIHPDDAARYKRYAQEWFEDKTDTCSLRFMVAPGKYEWFDVKVKKIFDEHGDLECVFGKLVNIQEKKELKADLASLNEYLAILQKLVDKILFHIDIETNTFYHADKNAQSFGISSKTPNYVETFIQQGFVRPEDADNYREYTQKVATCDNVDYEIQSAVDVGTYEWFCIKTRLIYNQDGKPVRIVGAMENIQWKKDLELKASHDLMTKVLNKVSFETQVAEILANSQETERHALIFIDLDDFKGVNDTLGHSFGDSLLITVGQRLKRVVRESDLVGRVGGDEFVVFLKNIGNENSALSRTKILLETLKRDFSFDGKSRTIKASLGVAIFPIHGNDYEELIKKSDIALYHSKELGKNVATLYNCELTKQ